MKPPKNLDNLADILHQLRLDRRRRKAELNPPKGTRKTLTPAERKLILAKTNKRCHICGGEINGKWQADHVLAHSGGGEHAIDNYLPAHHLCNNYRWDYSAEEFQYILKIGVWARTQIEKQTQLGQDMGEKYLAHEHRREKRRKKPAT